MRKNLGMIIYESIMILFNIALILIFRESINVTPLSIVPIFLMALLIFQALCFSHEQDKFSAYGSNYTKAEECEMSHFSSMFIFLNLLWFVPFIVFFSWGKLFSLLIYVFVFIGGPLIYKIKNRSKINQRIMNEAIELKEQQQRENQGYWK